MNREPRTVVELAFHPEAWEHLWRLWGRAVTPWGDDIFGPLRGHFGHFWENRPFFLGTHNLSTVKSQNLKMGGMESHGENLSTPYPFGPPLDQYQKILGV